MDSPIAPITALPVREKAFGGSATGGGAGLVRGGGEELVSGVRAELATAGTGAKTHVVSLVKLSHIGTTLPQSPHPYDG